MVCVITVTNILNTNIYYSKCQCKSQVYLIFLFYFPLFVPTKVSNKDFTLDILISSGVPVQTKLAVIFLNYYFIIVRKFLMAHALVESLSSDQQTSNLLILHILTFILLSDQSGIKNSQVTTVRVLGLTYVYFNNLWCYSYICALSCFHRVNHFDRGRGICWDTCEDENLLSSRYLLFQPKKTSDTSLLEERFYILNNL